MNAATKVRVEKHFRHPPERVFDAFIDPASIGAWLFRTPEGVTERTQYDPRPGGSFEIFERRGADLARHWGEFIEIDRPRRVVFDFWVDEAPDDRTRVTVAFTPAGDGCDVVLTHGLEPQWAHYADRTHDGWTMILDNLGHVVETRR